MLPDAPGNDARQAFMHLGQKEYHHLILLHMLLRNLVFRLGLSLERHISPAVIQFLQLSCRTYGRRPALALQQLQRPLRRIQPASGIQANWRILMGSG